MPREKNLEGNRLECLQRLLILWVAGLLLIFMLLVVLKRSLMFFSKTCIVFITRRAFLLCDQVVSVNLETKGVQVIAWHCVHTIGAMNLLVSYSGFGKAHLKSKLAKQWKLQGSNSCWAYIAGNNDFFSGTFILQASQPLHIHACSEPWMLFSAVPRAQRCIQKPDDNSALLRPPLPTAFIPLAPSPCPLWG